MWTLLTGIENEDQLKFDFFSYQLIYQLNLEMSYRKNDPKFSTKAIHSGQSPEQWHTTMGVVPPISTATTFKQSAPAEFKRYDYSRSGNPTREALELCIAALDNAQFGLTFSSGLAASAVILHLLESGDHVVSMDDVYGGTNRYFNKVVKPKMKIDFDFVDCTQIDLVEKAIRPNTKLVWIETPTNPTLKIVDIKAVADLVHGVNKDIIVVVDNTFLTSYFQRPLELGADLVSYSLTKYMNGHTDVVMGAITGNSPVLKEKLLFLQNAIGPVPSPFDCYLVNRSLKTLKVRMDEHERNALKVGKFLESHPCIEKLIHPGMDSHPQRQLVLKQQYGHSGMLSFYLKGGLEESKSFLSSLKIITLAESLGGYESLAELPSLMTHASVSAEERKKLGVADNLIRLSVGLENADDLIEDLDKALKKACKI